MKKSLPYHLLFPFYIENLHSSNTCELSQSCLTLWSPMDCSLPGSSVCGILQARIQEWVAIPFSRGSSQPRDRTHISCITGRFFTIWVTRDATSKPLPLDTHHSRTEFSECSSNITPEWLKCRRKPCHTLLGVNFCKDSQVITVHMEVREFV